MFQARQPVSTKIHCSKLDQAECQQNVQCSSIYFLVCLFCYMCTVLVAAFMLNMAKV